MAFILAPGLLLPDSPSRVGFHRRRSQLAQMILTVEAGIRLEQAADPQGPEPPAAFEQLRGFIESALPSGDGARKARRPS